MGRVTAMWRGALLALGLSVTSGAVMAENPVVIELYTSQGCSSCPPADKLLHELAKQDGVIALALHVDYWDYIGWKDQFADPRFTERQKNYARAAGARSIYTPQMIIGGIDHVVGAKPAEVSKYLKAHAQKPAVINIAAERNGDAFTLRARSAERVGDLTVFVVTYRPVSKVDIKRGENAGRTLSYANVVTSWTEAKRWNGRGEYRLNADLPTATEPAVVLFQRDGYGEILAAVELR
ncbi:MAG: DUF1223 domain-containing protein [Pseudomonadota bacterium]